MKIQGYPEEKRQKTDKHQDEYTYETAKRYILKSYGYTPVLYNKLNEFNRHSDEIFSMLDLHNPIEQSKYKRLCNLKYYEIKEVIYYLFEGIQSKPIDQEDDLFIKQFKKLTALYVMFKLLEENDITLNDIELFTRWGRGGDGMELKKFNTFKTFNKSHGKSILDFFYKNRLTDFQYIASLLLTCGIVFSVTNRTIKTEINARMQINRIYEPFYHPDGNFISVDDENSIDDVLNYFECEESRVYFMNKELPKIKKVYYEYSSDYFIKFFTAIVGELPNQLKTECDTIINNSFVTDEAYDVKYNNLCFKFKDEQNMSQAKEEYEQTLAVQKEQTDKDKKKIRNEKQFETKIICECGATTDKSNLSKHIKTPKHLKKVTKQETEQEK